ncbi:nuclear transport factor 2 family protein [Peterkaempfera bronchialis]|nr:nuclear transport factor 2 family protein [Peterkaempfera bronchialis]
MSEQTAAVMERLYDGLARADIKAVLAEFDPEAEIVTPESLPWSTGHYTGLQGATAYFAGALDYLEETRFDVDEVRTAGEWAAVIGFWYGRFKDGGGEFNVRFVHFWTLRGGRVVKGEGISDTDGIVAAFESRTAAAG